MSPALPKDCAGSMNCGESWHDAWNALSPITQVTLFLKLLPGLTPELVRYVEQEWTFWGRLDQKSRRLPPWWTWLVLGGRGAGKQPGEFRKGQVWIGGATPALAHFVPPPPDALDEALAAFERFLHVPATDTSPLIKAALAHVQFETIHPFGDGNGRLGRLLIALILCNEGVLREPSLYLSLYFKRRRADYYDMLNGVRVRGDWEAWLGFFLEGVAETAQQAVETAQRLLALLARDRARIAALGTRAGNVGLVFDQFARRVLLGVPQVQPQMALSAPTIRAAIRTLEDMEIVNELTGQRRHRVFAYSDYLAILSEGAQPL